MSKKVISIACDTEFTSFDRIGADVLATGLVEIFEDYTLGREQIFYSAPTSQKYFTESARKIHGFSYWKSMEFPSKRESCISMLNWLKPIIDQMPLGFICHGNGHLDYGYLKWHFMHVELQDSFIKAFCETKRVNTIKLAKENLKNLDNYKLNTIADFYKIEIDHHEALSDARACAQIYCNIMKGKDTWTGEFDFN